MEGRGTEEGSHKGRAKVLWIYMHLWVVSVVMVYSMYVRIMCMCMA